MFSKIYLYKFQIIFFIYLLQPVGCINGCFWMMKLPKVSYARIERGPIENITIKY